MALESKVLLLDDMKRKLADVITASDMAKVIRLLTDELDDYEVVRLSEYEPDEDDLLDTYLNALTVQGRSRKTIDRYKYLIGKLNDTLRIPTRKITVHHLRRYLSDEKARGLSDRTLDGMRQVFSAYFGWLKKEDLIERDPTVNLGTIRYAKKQRELYSNADIELLKFGCKNIRDRAIICFLIATGCRIGEVVRLNRDSINTESMECKVLGKGNKERTVYLDQIAVMTLKAYLCERTDDYQALFVGKGTERLQPAAIRKMLKDLGESTGVGHVHPHKFRRTMATNLIKHGMSIQEVAAILGHDKIDTTMQYVVLDNTEIKHAYHKYA